MEDIFKAMAKKQQGARTDIPQKSVKPSIDTREELSKVAGVSHDTIAKVKIIEEKATPEQKAKLQTGDATINEVYKEVRREEGRYSSTRRTILIFTDMFWYFFQQFPEQRMIVL